MKLGIVYWTSGGNTEALAEKVKEVAEANGAEVYFAAVDELDKDQFFACDVLAFGSPAQGAEELSPDIQALMDDITDELQDKKVFMFGSYGWGGGAYMDDWKAQMEEKGAEIAYDPVVCLEAPEDDAFAEIEEATKDLLK